MVGVIENVCTYDERLHKHRVTKRNNRGKSGYAQDPITYRV